MPSSEQYMSVFGVQFDVLADEEVEDAVAVEVRERRGRPPARSGEAGAFRRIAETTLAVIQEEPDVFQARDHDVGKPVVVHVADGDTHAEEGDSQAAFLRPVLEADRAAGARDVAVEGERGLGAPRREGLQPSSGR